MQNRMKTERGFTLIELLIVVMIIFIISAMALPNIMQSVRIMQMRSTGTSIVSIFEQARMRAISANAPLQVRNAVNAEGRTIFYVDTDGSKAWTTAPVEPMAMLPQGYSIQTAPPGSITSKFPTNATINSMAVESEGTDPATILGFNTRGLPCKGAPCYYMNANKPTNYVVYFTDGRQTGAVTISQMGKMKTYVYTGSSYN